MSQTILMAAAAVNLVLVACFITASKFGHIMVFQFFPILFAFGIGVFAFARVMGWPI